MTTQYQILEAVYDRLEAVTTLGYVGYYPDNYNLVVSTNLPAVLIVDGNSTTQFRAGRRNHNRLFISLMLYTDFTTSRLEQVLEIQNAVINAVISDIQYDGLVSNIYGYSVQVGDISSLSLPSATGMQGQMTVRKITFDFQYYTEGIS